MVLCVYHTTGGHGVTLQQIVVLISYCPDVSTGLAAICEVLVGSCEPPYNV